MSSEFEQWRQQKRREEAEMEARRGAAPTPSPDVLQELAAAAGRANPPPMSPPLGTERVWFVEDAFGRRGPMSEKEVANALAAGRVQQNAAVWQQGWHSWQPILSYFRVPPASPFAKRPGRPGPPAAAIVILVLVGLCVFGSVVRRFSPTDSPGRTAVAPNAVEPGRPIEEIDAASLAVAYHDRPKETASWYAMKTIDLVIPVDAVSQSGDTGIVTCTANFNTRVECSFGKSGVEGLSQIQRGQLLTVRGTCMVMERGSIVLMGCQVRAVHGNGKKYF